MSCSSTNANGLDSCNNNTPESAVSIDCHIDRNDTFFEKKLWLWLFRHRMAHRAPVIHGRTHALLPDGVAEDLLRRAAQGKLRESEPRGREYDSVSRPTSTKGLIHLAS